MHFGDLHPIFLHFPIVMLTMVLLMDLYQWITKKDWGRANLYLTFWAVLFLIPTILTGLSAAGRFNAESAALLSHRNYGFVTFGFSIVHWIYRYNLYKKGVALARIKTLALVSFINFLLISITAEKGGMLTFGHTFLTAGLFPLFLLFPRKR